MTTGFTKSPASTLSRKGAPSVVGGWLPKATCQAESTMCTVKGVSMRLVQRTALVAATVLTVNTAHSQSQLAPKVEGAWARPTVHGQAGGGGYLKITGGSTPDRLLGANASISKEVELHTMEMDGNVMRMRQIEGIDIPAGKSVELKPGGQHVMFVGLKQTLKNGAHFPIKLRFQKAGEITVEMKVMVSADAAPVKH
jgi:periplasmic copper chaperone A